MLPHHQMYTLVFLNNDVSIDLQPSVMPFHFPSTINIMLDISSIIDLSIFQQLGHIAPYYHKSISSPFLISLDGSYISTPSLFSPTFSTCISIHSVPLLQCSNDSPFSLWSIPKLEAGGTKNVVQSILSFDESSNYLTLCGGMQLINFCNACY